MLNEFFARWNLSKHQSDQFERYYNLLCEWNERINLTAITQQTEIEAYHFDDSLYLTKVIDISACTGIADVGTGGGLPGIPLAICAPDTKVVLIEVNQKKIQFLEAVIQELNLSNCSVYPYDWRTFLRTTEYEIDLFVSRASLHTDELMRVFKPGCRYKNARLVYWASKEWDQDEKDAPFLVSQYEYRVKNRIRKLVLFQRGEHLP